jgi:hypothetical protein
MLNRFLPMLLCAVSMLAQQQPKAEDCRQPYVVSEAYEVYSALLSQEDMARAGREVGSSYGNGVIET